MREVQSAWNFGRYWVPILVSTAWFPVSLIRINRLGYDFPIYYYWAQGIKRGDWVYKDYVLYAFKPFTLLPLDWAFGVFYILMVLAWIGILKHLPHNLIGMALWVLSFYPMLLNLELGQITPILAWMCLFPAGSLLAGLVKPYCLIFSALHLITMFFRTSGFLSTRKQPEPTTKPAKPAFRGYMPHVGYALAVCLALYIAMPSAEVFATLQQKDGGIWRKWHIIYLLSAVVVVNQFRVSVLNRLPAPQPDPEHPFEKKI